MDKLNIIFLHGWLFNSQIWSTIQQKFESDILVKTPDFNGYNDATKNREFNLSDSVCTDSTVENILVGWSYGSMVALEYAMRNEHVSKLILINFNISSHEDTFMSDSAITKLSENLKVDRRKSIRNFAFECCKNSKSMITDFKRLDALMKTWIFPEQNILQDNLNHIRYLRGKLISLENLNVNTLIINGEFDNFFSIDKNIITNKKINYKIISGMGHFPFFSYQAEIVDQIKQFIGVKS